MKHSDLCEISSGIDNELEQWAHNNGCTSWHLLEFDLDKPITPSVIIKRYVHET